MLYAGEVGKSSLCIDLDQQRTHNGYDICGKALRIQIKKIDMNEKNRLYASSFNPLHNPYNPGPAIIPPNNTFGG